MQASAIFTCIVLTVKALTDIFYTLVLFQRQATEVTYVTISIYLVLFVVELSPITGLVWLVTYPTGSNGKVPAVMCLLSILFGQFVLIMGPWPIFRDIEKGKYFQSAAVVVFLVVLCLNAVGLVCVLEVALHHSFAVIFFSVGNGLSFLYWWIAFPLLVTRTVAVSQPREIFRIYQNICWAWLSSSLCIPLLIALPFYLKSAWVLPGTLIVTWLCLLPWMLVKFIVFFQTAKADTPRSDADLYPENAQIRATTSYESHQGLVSTSTTASSIDKKLMARHLRDLNAQEGRKIENLHLLTYEWYTKVNGHQTIPLSKTELSKVPKIIAAWMKDFSEIQSQKGLLMSGAIQNNRTETLVIKVKQFGSVCAIESSRKGGYIIGNIEEALDNVQSLLDELAGGA